MPALPAVERSRDRLLPCVNVKAGIHNARNQDMSKAFAFDMNVVLLARRKLLALKLGQLGPVQPISFLIQDDLFGKSEAAKGLIPNSKDLGGS